jgi:hypothetical protein
MSAGIPADMLQTATRYIAAELRFALELAREDGQVDTRSAELTLARLAESFALRFARTNPAFDRAEFYRLAGIPA